MIVSLWGIEGSGKSTVGLTYPKPLFHLDLDLGGFERAAWRIIEEAKKAGVELRVKVCEPGEDVKSIDWSEWDIVSKPYFAPVQLDKLLGVPEQKQGVSVRFPRQVVGIKELWQAIVLDVIAVGNVPIVKSIMIDSATQIWWLCHTSLLQEKQEIQMGKGMATDNKDFRERLTPMEFPNNRMRDLIYSVRSFGKHLIMTHYPKDVYKERVGTNGIESYKSGDVEPDGFKHTVTLDDLVLWCYTEVDKQKEITGVVDGKMGKVPNPHYNKPQPYARIDLKCGLQHMGMSAVGLELPSPSYEGLMELQAMMKGE